VILELKIGVEFLHSCRDLTGERVGSLIKDIVIAGRMDSHRIE
jgi:hypothetical protein